MQDAGDVGGVNGSCDVAQVARGGFGGQRPVGAELGEVRALDVFHRQIRVTLRLADVVDGNDVGVL
jgi:hypothetical protein